MKKAFATTVLLVAALGLTGCNNTDQNNCESAAPLQIERTAVTAPLAPPRPAPPAPRPAPPKPAPVKPAPDKPKQESKTTTKTAPKAVKPVQQQRSAPQRQGSHSQPSVYPWYYFGMGAALSGDDHDEDYECQPQ